MTKTTIIIMIMIMIMDWFLPLWEFSGPLCIFPLFPASFTESVHSYSSEDLFPPAQVSVIQAFREYGWLVTERHTKILGRDLANWAVASRVFILIFFLFHLVHLVSQSTMSSWSLHGQVCDLFIWLVITSWHSKTAPRNAFPLEKCPKIRISENQENYS